MTAAEFGERIRIQRESRGLDIENLASRFKLSVRMLQAIEEGRLGNLPHAVYARSFVRSYAKAVGLSVEEIDLALEDVFPRHLIEDQNAVSEQVGRYSGKSLPFNAVTIVTALSALVIVALLLSGGWFVLSHYGDTILEYIKSPSTTADSSTAPVSQADTPVASEMEAQNPSPYPQTGTISTDEEAMEEKASPALAPVDSQRTHSSEDQSPPAAQADIHSLRIDAQQSCWIEYKSDDKNVNSLTLTPGKNITIDYKQQLRLVLGNPAGVRLTLDSVAYPIQGKLTGRRSLHFP